MMSAVMTGACGPRIATCSRRLTARSFRLHVASLSKPTVQVSKHVPVVNAEIRGTDIVYRNHYDIGIAVGGGKGLVVPVLRHAEHLSFAEIEKAIAEFSQRAQKNQLKVEELQGGTFTISNGGVYGSLLSTPIVNPPQSGILGLHTIQERPVARSGQVVIRPMMYVALTYDHRVVDGRDAVTFLKTVKECVEEPARMLLESESALARDAHRARCRDYVVVRFLPVILFGPCSIKPVAAARERVHCWQRSRFFLPAACKRSIDIAAAIPK